MKTKFIFSLLTALLFNFATSGLFAQSIGIDHNLMFGIQMGLSLVPLQLTGCLADGLNKEIWIPEIIEKFYPETSFVSDSRDFSMWTDNEYLNLQEAGIDPRVFIDNEVYPIPVVARGDKPYKIPMKRFDTENTVHINAIEIEESAEKRRSVAAGHQKSLQMQFSELAIYNWAPKKDSETTPVIKINDGNASKQGTGYVEDCFQVGSSVIHIVSIIIQINFPIGIAQVRAACVVCRLRRILAICQFVVRGIVGNQDALTRLEGIVVPVSGECHYGTLSAGVEVFVAVGLPRIRCLLVAGRCGQNEIVQILYFV